MKPDSSWREAGFDLVRIVLLPPRGRPEKTMKSRYLAVGGIDTGALPVLVRLIVAFGPATIQASKASASEVGKREPVRLPEFASRLRDFVPQFCQFSGFFGGEVSVGS